MYAEVIVTAKILQTCAAYFAEGKQQLKVLVSATVVFAFYQQQLFISRLLF